MKPIIEIEKVDNEYAKFVCKCFEVRNEIYESYNIQLSMREFDNILIDQANRKLALK